MNLYLVGGAVRDALLGRPVKDLDFAVEAHSYEQMRDDLHVRGLTIWKEMPQFVTLRGSIPVENLGDFGDHLDNYSGRVNADFTLCRKESQYTDKRHPDVVTPADIYTDLSRRDFTINAIALGQDGVLFDPFGGETDLMVGVLRCVGLPSERFTEDPLRILRAMRFAVTLDFDISYETREAMSDLRLLSGLKSLPVERVREELNRALAHNWRETMLFLIMEFPRLGNALFEDFPNLWLRATTEER